MPLAPFAAWGLAACTSAPSPASGTAAAANGEGGTAYPLTLENCSSSVTLPAAPTRIVLLETAPVTVLNGLGVLDRVIAKAGVFPPASYPETIHGDLAQRVDAIPVLSDDIDGAGHLQINQESVIAQSPDLVLGLPDGVTREGLASAGAQVLVQTVYCGAAPAASWDDLDAEIRLHAEVLDRKDAGEELIATLASRLDAVRETAAARRGGTCAVLYPTVGGGPLYAYGAASMASPQLEAVGLENVFAGTAERVFEASTEALIDADPDHLVILYQGEGDGSDVIAEVTGTAALGSLRAVREGRVLAQLFNLTEPATPLVVDGAERLGDWLDGGAS
ncbi:ABC transporter substrate-binding protein [Brachybacterium rhamnosum]|uniref:ABC transporter substrate-binding protein n=1 Tax=Brachybacterium rhamnosum TaxID=173361 RepID=A0ABW4PV82_9MICO